MIYNSENTAGAGRPCRVYDADGSEIRYVIECDTKTGAVQRYANHGRQFTVDAASPRGDVVMEIRKTPLIIEWLSRPRIKKTGPVDTIQGRQTANDNLEAPYLKRTQKKNS